jgi:hypothetical protein
LRECAEVEGTVKPALLSQPHACATRNGLEVLTQLTRYHGFEQVRLPPQTPDSPDEAFPAELDARYRQCMYLRD